MAQESQLQARIIKDLKKRGAYVKKNVLSNRSGIPDIDGCFKGKYFAIEVKAPGKVPTTLQKYNIDKINEANGVAFWVDNFADYTQLFESRLLYIN